MASVEVTPSDEDLLYSPAGADSNVLDEFINNNLSGAPLTLSEEKAALENLQ